MPVERQNQAMDFEHVTLRRAGHGDARALATLAELDSQRLPDDEFLIGEVAGEPWAALGLGSGILVADPYRPTVELAELLRLRAGVDANDRAAAVQRPVAKGAEVPAL
jgi:hypothetical protein